MTRLTRLLALSSVVNDMVQLVNAALSFHDDYARIDPAVVPDDDVEFSGLNNSQLDQSHAEHAANESSVQGNLQVQQAALYDQQQRMTKFMIVLVFLATYTAAEQLHQLSEVIL